MISKIAGIKSYRVGKLIQQLGTIAQLLDTELEHYQYKNELLLTDFLLETASLVDIKEFKDSRKDLFLVHSLIYDLSLPTSLSAIAYRAKEFSSGTLPLSVTERLNELCCRLFDNSFNEPPNIPLMQQDLSTIIQTIQWVDDTMANDWDHRDAVTS